MTEPVVRIILGCCTRRKTYCIAVWNLLPRHAAKFLVHQKHQQAKKHRYQCGEKAVDRITTISSIEEYNAVGNNYSHTLHRLVLLFLLQPVVIHHRPNFAIREIIAQPLFDRRSRHSGFNNYRQNGCAFCRRHQLFQLQITGINKRRKMALDSADSQVA